jgi:hypothetical protein
MVGLMAIGSRRAWNVGFPFGQNTPNLRQARFSVFRRSGPCIRLEEVVWRGANLRLDFLSFV